MKKKAITTLAALVALSAVAATARSNSDERFEWWAPSYIGMWNLKVGSAAVYDLQGPAGQKSVLELAVVGNEVVAGNQGYWVEISSHTEATAESLVMKVLLYRDVRPARHARNPVSWLFSDTAARNNIVVTRCVLQKPQHAPWAWSGCVFGNEFVEMLSGYRPPPPGLLCDGTGCYAGPEGLPGTPKTKDLGKENIPTQAGTLSCEHLKFRRGEGEVWVTADAPPFGLVKAVAKDNTTMVLTRLLTDAKDRIIGTPTQPNAWQTRDLFSNGDLWNWLEAPPPE